MSRTNSSSPLARGHLGLAVATTPRFPPARQLPRVGAGFHRGKLLEAQQARSYFSRICSWTPPIVLSSHTLRLCRRFQWGGGKEGVDAGTHSLTLNTTHGVCTALGSISHKRRTHRANCLNAKTHQLDMRPNRHHAESSPKARQLISNTAGTHCYLYMSTAV